MENWLWKKLWTCRQTDCGANEVSYVTKLIRYILFILYVYDYDVIVRVIDIVAQTLLRRNE